MYTDHDDNNIYSQSQYSQRSTWPEENNGKKKSGNGGKILALTLGCSMLGGLMGFGGGLLGARAADGGDSTTILQGSRENSKIELATIDTSQQLSAAEVYAQNVNSTVGITTSTTTNFWGYKTSSAASGSGFILTEDGYILTNYHVIENSDSVTVTLYDGSSYPATIIGYDESNDIAVLRIEAQGLSPVVLGDSDNSNVGDGVVAIGNPLGELTFSLTSGSVSALDREITMSNGNTMELIQTDCAINSGNSGGALFNMYGEVIGITNAKYSSSSSGASVDNIGFAIPINNVRSIVQSIIEKGYIEKPYIGVSVADVSSETQAYGLPQGAAVREIKEGSPAEEAGLQLNDIITKVNDTDISGSSDLVKFINDCSAGDVLRLTVFRQGESIELELTVGEEIQSAVENTSSTQQEESSSVQGMFPFGFMP